MSRRLIDAAKILRNRSTETEKVLWDHLRAKRLNGLKFKRQQPIGSYIVDFVCFERKVIIELDGGQHRQPDQARRDEERDKWFEAQGYRVLRFWDNEVLQHTREVLEVIEGRCRETPLPSPSPTRGEG